MGEIIEAGLSDRERIVRAEKGNEKGIEQSNKDEYQPKSGTLDEVRGKLISATNRLLDNPESSLTAEEGQRMLFMLNDMQEVTRRLGPFEIDRNATGTGYYLDKEEELTKEAKGLKIGGMDTRGLEARATAYHDMADFSRRVSGGIGTGGVQEDPATVLLDILRPQK